jgi:cytosine/adenosine deaminase-related metal-dependent hydrolase
MATAWRITIGSSAKGRQVSIEGARLLRGERLVTSSLILRGSVLGALDGPPGEGIRLALDGLILLPGLINAHDHLHLNAFGGPVCPGPYGHADDWVEAMRQRIAAPDFRKIRDLPEAVRAWHGALKNVLAGCTTVVHHDPGLRVFEDPDFPVHVPRRLGWAHSPSLAGRYGPSLVDALRQAPAGRPFFIHAAEGVDARAHTDIEALEEADAVGPELRLVHMIGASEAQSRRARAAGAAMVWCPASSRHLFGRLAEVEPWARMGRALLGSDARLTGSRDLLDELALAAEAEVLDARQLMAMVGGLGAELVGRPEAGRLEPGAPADLVAVDDDAEDPARTLIGKRRADLRLVVVGGRPLVSDPDLGEIFEAMAEPCERVRLDGRPKLLALRAFDRLRRTGLQEPGLDWDAAEGVLMLEDARSHENKPPSPDLDSGAPALAQDRSAQRSGVTAL